MHKLTKEQEQEQYNQGWNDALDSVEGVHKREIKKAVKQEREKIIDKSEEIYNKYITMNSDDFWGSDHQRWGYDPDYRDLFESGMLEIKNEIEQKR